VFQNPRVLVSTIVALGESILACRRAHEPAAGLWALPGGFMECAETLEEAAARETFEETGGRLAPTTLRLHAVSTLPEISEVYVGFLAVLTQPPKLVCGSECRAVRFFEEADMPWAKLSYPDVGEYLRVYFQEHRQDTHVVHFSRLDASGVSSTAITSQPSADTYVALSPCPRALSELTSSDSVCPAASCANTVKNRHSGPYADSIIVAV
jgi:ADP-ribose pyrophosphatase YjhB (NUDIX family)